MTQDIQTFLNVHFVSIKLAKALQEKGRNAMLHFFYNSRVNYTDSEVVGCLVNHSYSKGVFVMQIPISTDIVNLDEILDVKSKQVVLNALSTALGITEQDIE